jgi:hypothetical protein
MEKQTLALLAHWDGATWNYAATSRDVGVTALGATSEDIWAATTTAQMLRMKRK